MSPRPTPAGVDVDRCARWSTRLAHSLAELRSATAPDVPDAVLDARRETFGRVGTTQFLEEAAPEEALRRYRSALDDVRLYCRWPVERGLLGELQEPDQQVEPLVLDRLTRLLERLGRAREILAVATDYFAAFPEATRTPAGARVRRRCERAAAGTLQFGSRPVPARARQGRVLG
jgi:hypothetical protein